MSFTPETLLRHWQMLRLLPRYPKKITASTLCEALWAEGYSVAKRTVERDLQALSRIFPLTADERTKPYGWSWNRDVAAFDLPGLSLSESLTLLMAHEHLRLVLPSSTISQMEPYFRLAEQKLKALDERSGIANWHSMVRIIPASQPLIAPQIDSHVLASIQQGLLEARQCQINYCKKDVSESEQYPVHPLGLIQRGPIIYLACTIRTYPDIRILALHRIKQVELLNEAASRPKSFDLDKYIASGAFGWSDSTPIKLVADFTPSAGSHLQETPLSEDQKIERLPNGLLRISASIQETQQLIWWLLGFGDGIEVIEPLSLRQKIIEKIQGMANTYSLKGAVE